MLSFKLRRILMSWLVTLMWLGAIIFLAVMVYPAAKDAFSKYAKVKRGDADLKEWTASIRSIPSIGLINWYGELKFRMRQEVDSCSRHMLSRNKALDEQILESWSGDEHQFATQYEQFKARLADKAGNPDFIEMGQLDDWEDEATGAPEKEDFTAIEKRACIAEVLVDALAVDESTVIQIIDFSKPVKTPDNLPEQPPADWDLGSHRVARHRIVPVVITFTTRFAALGRTLDRLAKSPARGLSGRPCMAIRAIRFGTDDSVQKGNVKVRLAVEVYDFYRLDTET
jgi:hypothetical protein